MNPRALPGTAVNTLWHRDQALTIAAAYCHRPATEAVHNASTAGLNRQRDHLAGRMAARLAMQHFMGGTSDTWLTVVNDRFGIPRFAQRGERLSIAHHEGIGLAAVSSGASVGIDIEALHHFESLPLRILGYEDSALARLANTQGATPAQLKCALWVTMEALGKSLGTGLTAGADALRVVDVEHYHWGWRMGFQRYPQASAYVWPVPERLVGLVVHARALTASAQVGQHLRRLICAAQRSACPVDAIAIRRMKTRAPLAFENPAESGCLG